MSTIYIYIYVLQLLIVLDVYKYHAYTSYVGNVAGALQISAAGSAAA